MGTDVRYRNWRLVIVGIIVMAAAGAFFGGMETLAPSSNDPVTLMRIVGEVAGVVGVIGLGMVFLGLIGIKK